MKPGSILLTSVLLAAGTGSLSLAQESDSPTLFRPGAPGEDAQPITVEESYELGRTSHTEDDVRFMQHMILHHAQAVEMVDMIEERSTHPGVQQLGLRIELSQDAEIAFMKNWLTSRGEALEDDELGHGHHGMHHGQMDDDGMNHSMDPADTPIMPGMLSPAQMAALRASSGTEFDQLFLSGMIQHHQGALDMVAALREIPTAGNDPRLSSFLNDIHADQSAEITRMRRMLADINS